jgi:hypothetical protein
VLSVDSDTSPAMVPLEPFSFFTIQGFGNKNKKLKRSYTSDSSRALISKSEPSSSIEIYSSYHASLNSLIEIVHNVRLALLGMLIMQLTGSFHRRMTPPHSKRFTTSFTPMMMMMTTTTMTRSARRLMTAITIQVNQMSHPQQPPNVTTGDTPSRFVRL